MKNTPLLYISLLAALGLTSCQTAHLIGYEVYNSTSEPVRCDAVNMAYHGKEIAPGETVELDVFIGPGKLKPAYASDTVYRKEVEKSIYRIEESHLSTLSLNWQYHKMGMSKGRGTLCISGTAVDNKPSASR